jgi:hypothetical protein
VRSLIPIRIRVPVDRPSVEAPPAIRRSPRSSRGSDRRRGSHRVTAAIATTGGLVDQGPGTTDWSRS